jgi:hypothetical protein
VRHFWSGHAPKHISERYTKLRKERDFGLKWVEKIGLGFDLPDPIGQLGATARRLESRPGDEKMVDETGVEPATASLPTMREDR